MEHESAKRSDYELIAAHYQNCWSVDSEPMFWNSGPTWQLTPGFRILVFPPHLGRDTWTYATCVMSLQGDAPSLELHLFSPIKAEAHVELLTIVAHYHLTGDYLDIGHTVNFGRPWFPNSKCDRGLISLPYLDGPKLEWLKQTSRRTRCLWLIPVTHDEVQYAISNGLQSLEDRFEASNFDYLKPERPSVI